MSGEAVIGDCSVSIFNPISKRSIGGIVGADGAFEIKDIPLGEYQVSVTQKPNTGPTNAPFDKRIGRKFRDPDTSGISTKIEEGINSIEIDLAL